VEKTTSPETDFLEPKPSPKKTAPFINSSFPKKQENFSFIKKTIKLKKEYKFNGKKMQKQLSFTEGLKKAKEKINELKKKKQVVLVAIAGSSCSGKSLFARKLGEKTISMDDYYLGIDLMKNKDNFDEPSAMDLKLLKRHLLKLKKGESVEKPLYDFKTHKRKGFEELCSPQVLVVEGLFVLHPLLVDLFDLRIWIEASERKRLQRRLKRDTKERGWKRKEILAQWSKTVQPMYLLHVAPTKKKADLVVKN
jgi:uridine kinase